MGAGFVQYDLFADALCMEPWFSVNNTCNVCANVSGMFVWVCLFVDLFVSLLVS